MAKVLFVICVPSEEAKTEKNGCGDKDNKKDNDSTKDTGKNDDLDSEVMSASVRRLKLPRNSLPALFETGDTNITVTGDSNADVTDMNLKTSGQGKGRKSSLKNIFLDVGGNKNSNTDPGKTLTKSSSCGLPRLSLLKNTDEASEIKKMENGLNDKKVKVDDVDLNKKVEKQCNNFEKREQNGHVDNVDHETEYISFISDGLTLLDRVKRALDLLGISAVNWSRTEDNVNVGMFIAADGVRCEEILEKLTFLDLGAIPGSSISVFPATISVASVVKDEQAEKLKLELEKENKLAEKVSEFKKSIKSRLVVAQVVDSVKSDAVFNFDFLMLVILAGMVAIMGLLEASPVSLVASMLISPLMGPIVAFVFGTVIKNMELLKVGVVTEMKGLTLCILVGFISGFIPAGLESAGMSWRSTDSWPTIEMSSRGSIRALPVGVLIAVPSGAGVALSILGGKVGSLVGVAISASLLPPAVNAGLLWANAIIVGITPPRTDPLQNSSATADVPYEASISCPTYFNNDYTHIYSCNMAVESLVLGVISLLLTIVNIICIFFMGILVLKIKEVAPIRSVPEAEKNFFARDLKVARQSYETMKGPNSSILGKKFLQEYKKFKKEIGVENNFTDNELNEILEDVEEGEDVKEILDKLPHRPKRW
ncbi:unnamed protein product, partial [Candidula unifasciata]